jgi:DNA invertase Pin-like site-specific DNA recombinase
VTRIASAYLRCSDPRQDKSIEQQRAEIERRAAIDGYVIPPGNWFIDEGISGRSIKRRKSYQAMIKRAEVQRDAMAGRGRPVVVDRIERMYVWAFSRIARNMFDCLRAIAILDDANIDITSLTENDTGDRSMRKLIRPILAWLAERYSEELSRNVSRGKQSQANKGFWAYGTHAFGYEIVQAQGGKKLVVTDAVRADFETVKRVFREAEERGDGSTRIAERLTREGIRPPSDGSHPRAVAPGTWRPRHVHNILRNPVYCGHVVYKGAIVARDAHEAAVDDATFARVCAKRSLKNEGRKGGRGNGLSPLATWQNGVLTPWLRCGTCGGRVGIVESTVGGQRSYLYFCGTRRDIKGSCPGVSVRVERLDSIVLDTIEKRVLTPENVTRMLAETLEALSNADGDDTTAERDRLTAQIADLDKRIRSTAHQVINGLIDEADARFMSAPLLAQRETARLHLAALPAKRGVPGVDEVDPVRFREAVLEAWKQRPLEERREALSMVLERVTLVPGGVQIAYSATGSCGDERMSCVIHARFPWMRLKRSPSCDRREK